MQFQCSLCAVVLAPVHAVYRDRTVDHRLCPRCVDVFPESQARMWTDLTETYVAGRHGADRLADYRPRDPTQ